MVLQKYIYEWTVKVIKLEIGCMFAIGIDLSTKHFCDKDFGTSWKFEIIHMQIMDLNMI